MSTTPQEAVLLLGPTGSGKTPLGDSLESSGLWGRACHHFDFGENLRRVVREGESDDFQGDDIAFLGGVLEQGLLLENESFRLAEKILSRFIDTRAVQSNDLLIMNGLPRHAGQAGALESRIRIIAIVELDCSAATVLERLRRNSGGDRKERVDDEEELVTRKLSIYKERTQPLVIHYQKEGAKLVRARAGIDTKPDEVRQEIEAHSPEK